MDGIDGIRPPTYRSECARCMLLEDEIVDLQQKAQAPQRRLTSAGRWLLWHVPPMGLFFSFMVTACVTNLWGAMANQAGYVEPLGVRVLVGIFFGILFSFLGLALSSLIRFIIQSLGPLWEVVPPEDK